jgi:hypothetical protein
MKTIHDLPSWFKLDNYDCLKEADMKTLYTQVRARQDLLSSIDIVSKFLHITDVKSADQFIETLRQADDKEFLQSLSINNYSMVSRVAPILTGWLWIVKGIASFPSSMIDIAADLINMRHMQDSDREETTPFPMLQGINIFTGTSVEDIKYYMSVANKNYLESVGKPISSLDTLSAEDTDFNRLIADTGIVIFKANLGQFQDKDIIDSFKSCLKKWRQDLDIKVDDKFNFVKPSHRSKIIEYNIIAYLDLLIWATASNIDIPYRVYTAALFPNGEKGEIEFRQTIKVFADKIINSEYVMT